MATVKNYKSFFNITILIVWVLISNICVTDAMLVTFHNFSNPHNFSNKSIEDKNLSLDQNNHTNYHLGHTLPHEHQGIPDHGPHGIDNSYAVVAIREAASAVNDKVLTFIPLILNYFYVSIPRYLSNLSQFWDVQTPKTFHYVNSALTRAPPALV